MTTFAVAALVVGVWGVLSVLSQLPLRLNDRIRRFDAFHLVPRWHFFAPNPATADFTIVYRAFGPGVDEIQPWQAVPARHERDALCAVWNPGRRARKLRDDAVKLALIMSQGTPADALRSFLLTTPYLLLLNTVCAAPLPGSAAFVQFAVLKTYGFHPRSPARVVIRSEVHRVDRH